MVVAGRLLQGSRRQPPPPRRACPDPARRRRPRGSPASRPACPKRSPPARKIESMATVDNIMEVDGSALPSTSSLLSPVSPLSTRPVTRRPSSKRPEPPRATSTETADPYQPDEQPARHASTLGPRKGTGYGRRRLRESADGAAPDYDLSICDLADRDPGKGRAAAAVRAAGDPAGYEMFAVDDLVLDFDLAVGEHRSVRPTDCRTPSSPWNSSAFT
jgi:hypothetical protein